MFSTPNLPPSRADPQRSLQPSEVAQLRAFVRYLNLALFGMAGLGEIAAALTGSLQLVVCGGMVACLALWLLWAWPRVTPEGLSRFVVQFAAGYFVLVLAVVALVPQVLPAVTLLGVLPVAVGLQHLSSKRLKVLMAAAWALSAVLTVAAKTLAGPPVVPDWAIELLSVASGSALGGLLLFLLWQYRTRLNESAQILAGLVLLARDVADTMDPHLVGERMARHVAEVSGAARCTISSWDRQADAVLTYATYPSDLTQSLATTYALPAYPLTRAVLETRQPISMHVDDPGADPGEVALMREAGETALVLLPLVARGETVGLIELTREGPPFSERDALLAFTFASEAAMTLENARLYEQLHHQAFHDPLTGLANRALFTDRLEHALARGQRLHARLAVLFVDVDDLKTVNDRLGHMKGDAVLAAVADRLRLSLRSADTPARIGGDEFAVLIEDLADAQEAEVVARRIVDVMSQPLAVGETQVTTGVSIGICATTSGSETADAVMRNADFAMYQAKLSGKGRVEAFRPSMRWDASERHALETLLYGAVERNELRLQYQPVVALGTGRIVGTEALVRWDSPDRGTLMPGDFIALAEETGLIVPIGRWVLEEACRHTRQWQGLAGRADFSISVNLSARQFQHAALQSDILAAIASSGIKPSSLVVEITESILMLHTPNTMATLEALRAAGVRVAVDDFGTGYSSLAYLQRFPIDILKVDRAFVNQAADIGDGAVLARAIVELARALRMRVVAEGIEQYEQLEALLSFGCQYGQGYLFSKPVDAGEIEAMLTWRPRTWDQLWARIREAGAHIPSGV
jgi:diguanylate cyclase (GGDEF)-like protein